MMAIRDTDAIPYRRTQAYAEAVAKAAIQRARLRHHAHELWAQGVGQATSAVMRRAWYGRTGR
jgi:hypothetical protein